VPPALGEQKCRDALVVFPPYRNVEIVVRSRDRAGVEIDGPTPEQPILDPSPFE
jgi:hypothetical protein